MKKNAKALEDHLTKIESQIFVMVQGLGSMGTGTAGPAMDPGASGEPAGMPSGIPNPGAQAAPAFPFPPAGRLTYLFRCCFLRMDLHIVCLKTILAPRLSI